MRLPRKLFAGLVAVACSIADASMIAEFGDAGSTLGASQDATGAEPVTAISGAFAPGFPDTDMYRLHLWAGTFVAALSIPAPPASGEDGRLFLFDAAGHGLVGTAVGSSMPLVKDILAEGDYFLAVTQGSLEPYGPKDQFGNDLPLFVQGVPSPSLVIASWGGVYHALEGPYTVTIRSAGPPQTVPEPLSALLVASAAVAAASQSKRRSGRRSD